MANIKTSASKTKNQFGQGMTEYIVIVALIAISAIGVYTAFGDTVRNQVAGMAKELAGVDASQQISQADLAAKDADTQAIADKGLNAYNGN